MSKFENLFQTFKMSLLSSSRFGGGGGQQQTSELESQIVNTVKQVILNPLLINLVTLCDRIYHTMLTIEDIV